MSKYRIIDSVNGYYVKHDVEKRHIETNIGQCGSSTEFSFFLSNVSGAPDFATADDVNAARAIIIELEKFIENAKHFCNKDS